MDSYDSYNTAKSGYKSNSKNYGSYYGSNYRTDGVQQEVLNDNIKVKSFKLVDRS